MKIAVVTEDGATISQHFGRAPYYLVVTVEDGKAVAREMRDKLGHAHFATEHHGEESHGSHAGGHGFDPAAQSRHAQMIAAIEDCEMLLARGMGAGAYSSIERAGIRPILTDITEIDQAVQAVISGDIVDHPEKLH
jgi:predicted Fe-Mo cluster-binding NifX family protein